MARVTANPAYGGAGAPGSPGGGGGGDGEAEAGKPKPALVVAAERLDRRTALLTGYLRKKNSANRWQKRYFEIVGQY